MTMNKLILALAASAATFAAQAQPVAPPAAAASAVPNETTLPAVIPRAETISGMRCQDSRGTEWWSVVAGGVAAAGGGCDWRDWP